MEPARIAILDAARELFVDQGFAQTTIQQLADQAGISKGAVYLHFRSKGDVLTALFQHLEQRLMERARALGERTDLEPVDRLREQLRLQFTEVREQQVLFEASLRDSNIALDEELSLIAQKSRVEWQTLQEESVRAAFPTIDERFLTDIAVCLNGAMNEYYTYVLLEGVDIDPDAVASLLVASARALVAGLETDALSPVLDRTGLLGRKELEQKLRAVSNQRIEAALTEIQETAEQAGEPDRSEIHETVDALRHALAQPGPSRVVLQGLVANLREWKTLANARKALAYELKLKLI